MRAELQPKGVEIVTVCLETLGAEEGRAFVEAANPEHPTLLDVGHSVDALFGITNIPNALWIDELGQIVRPVEPAWPAPRDLGQTKAQRPMANDAVDVQQASHDKVKDDSSCTMQGPRDEAVAAEQLAFACRRLGG